MSERTDATRGELMPCPHCGNAKEPCFTDARELFGHDDGDGPAGWFVTCNASNEHYGCGSSTGFCNTKAEALAAWNKRAVRSETATPTLWWNGLRNNDERDGTGPSVSEAEDTNHDIPLYSGANPHSEQQAVWNMLLLDGNCSDHTLTGAAKLRRILDDLIEARQALSTPSAIAPLLPETGRLIEAFTPTVYPGRHENFPPPFLNISEAQTPYEEAVITVRGQHKPDGSAGDAAAIVLRKYDLMGVMLRAARRCGWLPMTEEQWQRDYYASNPDKAKEARERIEQLQKRRDDAKRTVEETTSALADIPRPE